MVNLREELQSKLHCPKNKKFNQLEIDNYNLEEQILNADQIFKIMKYQNNDSIYIFSEHSEYSSKSKTSNSSVLGSKSKFEINVLKLIH